jgi:hypothetical protein
MPPGIRAIQAELAARRWDSLEEVQAFAARRMAEYNATPQAELGGLSPEEMHQLLGGDWQTLGPLRVNEALPLADLSGCPFLLAARALLAAGAEPGGVKATATGRLTRKAVATLLDATPWPGRAIADIRAVSRVINEEDFWPVHVLRVVLGVGKLLRHRSGAFRTTPHGRALLPEERAGALAAHLFRTFFREFNLAYLSFWPADGEPDDQALVPLFLLRVAALDDTWRQLHELVPLLDPAADVDEEIGRMRCWYPEGVREVESRDRLLPFAFGGFRARVLQPLEWFGLLEARERPSAVFPVLHDQMRKTPLFDALVMFPPSFVTAARRRV